MPVVQDAYFIPADIATGLATGLYRRYGSVIRFAVGENKGQIVKHLKPVPLDAAERTQGIAEKALQFVLDHKKEVGIASVGVAVASAGVWGYFKWKSYEPKVLTDFRAALKTYIDAIRKGNMDLNTINALMTALETLKTHKNYKKFNIQLTGDDLAVFVGHIYSYTVKLAEDNSVTFSVDELNQSSDAIINLQSYLEVQKMIFEAAA